jgi:hypothetical protein
MLITQNSLTRVMPGNHSSNALLQIGHFCDKSEPTQSKISPYLLYCLQVNLRE